MNETMIAERREDRQDLRRNEAQTPERQAERQAQSQQRRQEQPAMIPRVDVLEDESGITLFADLPGVPRDALEIHVEGDSLTIEGAEGDAGRVCRSARAALPPQLLAQP